jgi:hypothetical protein
MMSFMSRRSSGNDMKLKRAFFNRLFNWKSCSVQSQQRAERMRASVHFAYTGRLLRSAFKSFLQLAAVSRQSTKRSATDDMVQHLSARHSLCNAFKWWTVLSKETRLEALQQVTAYSLIMIFN